MLLIRRVKAPPPQDTHNHTTTTPLTRPLLTSPANPSKITLPGCLQVLNSFQMASLLVQAYPAVPDALAVASAVIADMNEKGQPLPSGLASLQANQGLAGGLHGGACGVVLPGWLRIGWGRWGLGRGVCLSVLSVCLSVWSQRMLLACEWCVHIPGL